MRKKENKTNENREIRVTKCKMIPLTIRTDVYSFIFSMIGDRMVYDL